MVAAPRLFTNSGAVVAAMMGLLPLLCVTLVVHTASMATEGMLLAGAPLADARSSSASVCIVGGAHPGLGVTASSYSLLFESVHHPMMVRIRRLYIDGSLIACCKASNMFHHGFASSLE